MDVSASYPPKTPGARQTLLPIINRAAKLQELIHIKEARLKQIRKDTLIGKCKCKRDAPFLSPTAAVAHQFSSPDTYEAPRRRDAWLKLLATPEPGLTQQKSEPVAPTLTRKAHVEVPQWVLQVCTPSLECGA